MAQSVEHILGKDEVGGSSPLSSSKGKTTEYGGFFYVLTQYLVRKQTNFIVFTFDNLVCFCKSLIAILFFPSLEFDAVIFELSEVTL